MRLASFFFDDWCWRKKKPFEWKGLVGVGNGLGITFDNNIAPLGDRYSSNCTYACDNCCVDDLMLDMISFSFLGFLLKR
jgi:hypothetical protein